MNTEKAKKALAAVLLFHSGSPWDETKRFEWLNLSVGVLGDKVRECSLEATTRNLCNLVREALEAPESQEAPESETFGRGLPGDE